MNESPFVAAVVGLAGCIAFLFRLVMKMNEKHVELSTRLGRLEGEHEAVQTLATQAITAVKEAIAEAAAMSPETPTNKSQ